jgi:hypothetical protein
MPVGGLLEKKEELSCYWNTVTFLYNIYIYVCVVSFFFVLVFEVNCILSVV